MTRATQKLARQVVRFQNAHRSGCLNMSRKFLNAQYDVEQAFFAALERETGIDRDLFKKLGGAL